MPGKRANVERELALLQDLKRSHGLSRAGLDRLTTDLKRTNSALWDIEDAIRRCERQGDFGPSFIELARSVYKENDKAVGAEAGDQRAVRFRYRGGEVFSSGVGRGSHQDFFWCFSDFEGFEGFLEAFEGEFDIEVLAVDKMDVCEGGFVRFEGLKRLAVYNVLNPAARIIAVAVMQGNLALLADGEAQSAGQMDVLRCKDGKDCVLLFIVNGFGNGEGQQVDRPLALLGLRDLHDLALRFGPGLLLARFGSNAAVKPIVEALRLDTRLSGCSG